MSTQDLMFVYGTLRSEIPSSMSKLLRRRARLIGPATTAGYLIDLGGYPALVLTPAASGERVQGEVYAVHPDQAEETRQLLDAYEGVTGQPSEQYRKAEVDVLQDHRPLRAVTYIYQLAADGYPVIAGGDYPSFYISAPAHQQFTGH